MSEKKYEMLSQLLKYGVEKNKILTWSRFKADFSNEKVLYCHENINYSKKSILIISTYLDYNGGTMAAKYAAMALKNKNYYVCLVAPDGNLNYIKELYEDGIDIIICPGILSIKEITWSWIKKFDFVIVNVFQMIAPACDISKNMPVLWWIHECSPRFSQIYQRVQDEFWDYDNIEKMKDINIVAVSNIAKRNFNFFYPDTIKNTLLFGIPDEMTDDYIFANEKKIVFALIGLICELKGQYEFIKAIKSLPCKLQEKCEFWLIGPMDSTQYCKEIQNLVKMNDQIKMFGTLNRKGMREAFKKIDVVVCASLEETMSIVIIEGLMYGKICITTDTTGIAEYIQNGINGYVYKTGDINALSKKMQYILNNYNELCAVRINARKTYKKFFSMEVFEMNLEKEIKLTLLNYKKENK